jgi:non-heme chloroperoxidase
MPTTTTEDGTDLFIKDWGDGPALLFVSSAAVSNDIWQYQHAHFFAAGYRVVAFDRRGHGRSSPSAGGYDADTLADDLAHVIEARRLRGVTLIGHSMGCGEIVRYLTRHGSARVERIVLVGGTTPFLLKTDDSPDGIDGGLVETMRAQWRKDFPGWAAGNVAPFFAAETSQAMMDWVVALICKTPVAIALACNKVVVETDYRPDCRAVSVPALVVHGARDVSAPVELTAKRTASLIGNSQLAIYDDAAHGLMFTHTDRLHADIARFIGTARTG